MGIRGELFSTRVTCNGRTYFFNVKENRMGDMFLTVVESKPTETEGFERRSVVVFREDMAEFVKALQGALDFMGKPERGSRAGAEGLNFAPAVKGPEKRLKTPDGFAGSEPAAPSASTAGPSASPAANKRRIVVRRKIAAPKKEE